jgi:hypothetical protein
MMGQIEEWFYQSLAGIVSDVENPGFKHFFVQPEIVGDMTFVKATYKSIYGKIASAWEKKDGKLFLKIEIPANTSATVKLPVERNTKIKVNGKSLEKLKLDLGFDANQKKTTLKLGSGIYTIECKL